MSTPLNLYGIPFRSWILLNQNNSWIQQAEMKTSQFSSQEKNQVVQRRPDLNLFHNVHSSFHLYFVTIITVLSAIISAFIFVIIVWRIYKCYKRVRKGSDCENQKLNSLPMADKRQISHPLPPTALPGNSRICQEVSSTTFKSRHLPGVSVAKTSANHSQQFSSYQSPLCQCYGSQIDNV